jgi:hypothetical protein
MARKPKDDSEPPKAGHNNPPLTKEDRAALLVHHVAKLRGQLGEIEIARAPFKAAQEALTDLVNTAKGDLGKAYSRKRLLALCEDVGSRLRDLAKEEEQRFQDRVALGLPVFGVQQDLFGGNASAMPQEKRDEFEWQSDGFLAGRRGDERKAPEGCPPRMDQFWLTGYDLGQAETVKSFSKVEEMISARTPKEPEPEPTEFDPDKEARALKKSGFLDTTAPDDDDDSEHAQPELAAAE